MVFENIFFHYLITFNDFLCVKVLQVLQDVPVVILFKNVRTTSLKNLKNELI